MSVLWWYPRAWRVRYGAELVALMESYDKEERSSFAMRVDLARAGLGERFRIFAPGELPRYERAREGILLVLYAWVLFVVGGFAVEKLSEHWQAVTPTSKRPLPSDAFTVLYWTSGIGSILVLVGLVVALPTVISYLRGGGWTDVLRPLIRSVLFSVLVVGATVGLSRWAHSLTPAKRNGSDGFYTAAFLGWFLLAATCLFSWVVAAATIARRLTFSIVTLRLLSALAGAIGLAMVVMTVATVVWWAAVARVAPWFFSGRAIGATGSVIQPNTIVASIIVSTAMTLGVIGATRSVRSGLRPTSDR